MMMTDDQKALDVEQLLREAGDRLLELGDKGCRRYWDAANALYAAKAASLEAQEPVAYGLQWPGDRAAGIVNWRTTFGTEEAAKEYAAGCGHADGITVAPLYLHPSA